MRVLSIHNIFGFSDNSASFSSDKDANAKLTFIGEAVAVYGTVSPDHANISVTVDGKAQLLSGGSGGFVSAMRPGVRGCPLDQLVYFTNKSNRPLS